MAGKSKKSKKADKAKKAKKAKRATEFAAEVNETSVEGSVDGSKRKMKRSEYEAAMEILQGELVAMQEWVKATGAKICVVFEGLDSAGKGGTIRRITERTSPRVFKHIALPAPTEREKSQMYIQRYIAHFPAAGEVAIFDRSWYNRAGVEPVLGFCTPEETERFLTIAPAGRAGDGRLGDHPDQVLAQRQRRGAGSSTGEQDRRPAQDLEAVADRPEVVRAALRVLPGPRQDARGHRHAVGVRGSWRTTTTRSAVASTSSRTCSTASPTSTVPRPDVEAARAAEPRRLHRAGSSGAPRPREVLSRDA